MVGVEHKPARKGTRDGESGTKGARTQFFFYQIGFLSVIFGSVHFVFFIGKARHLVKVVILTY